MLAVIGTVPDPGFPVVGGPAAIIRERLLIVGQSCPIQRGTPALLAAALATAQTLGQPPPQAYLVGDIGLGDGSRQLYAFLETELPQRRYQTLCFHYLQPDVDWHNRVMFAIEAMASRPRLIADAGYMYVAKMSGQAAAYDLFTPDVGELAFLADEEAPHPFYTRGFILHEDNLAPDLIQRAYAFDNAAKYLLVKGKTDYIASRQGILATVSAPEVAALEPIGGTGDTVTGIAVALITAGYDIPTAALLAARANRLAGQLADPTPATPVTAIIHHLPRALADVLAKPHSSDGLQLYSR
ncbi:MAG: NAD(P)H-hydrate dehydratase [Desulfobacca sp.]|uniref:NAD(P)H-hydrate dehydratase n=1 Tax=Desulfobacca sp. TaxID=2067990 RepID=UPI00404A0182